MFVEHCETVAMDPFDFVLTHTDTHTSICTHSHTCAHAHIHIHMGCIDGDQAHVRSAAAHSTLSDMGQARA